MSVVIAAKYNNGIALAADKQATAGTTKHDSVNKLQSFKYSNTGLGCVGWLRDCNLIRTLEEVVPYKDILDKIDINETYVIKNIIPPLFNHLSTNKRITNNNEVYEIGSQMIFVTPYKMFEIGGDFGVTESDCNYEAIGCGDDKIRGYMTSIGDTSYYSKDEISKLLHNAIIKACEKDVFINDNIDILFFERK